jgi:transposase
MPSAIAVPIRQQIVALRVQGKSYPEIATALDQSYSSVRRICRRYRAEDPQSLQPRYERCGHQARQFERLVYRSAIALKRQHPSWGGGIIRVKLQQRWSERAIPSERTLQRWFHQAGVNSAAPRVLPPRRLRSTVVHQCWQVDAVSHQPLVNGQQACWLSVTDEASRALLEASVFPLSVL